MQSHILFRFAQKTNVEEVFAYALISPFDIVGFQPNAINVTRLGYSRRL